jgi:hypothetical protein
LDVIPTCQVRRPDAPGLGQWAFGRRTSMAREPDHNDYERRQEQYESDESADFMAEEFQRELRDMER